ncbi:MAG: RIP metalloprotease RseP [Blastocatellia bacterium]|nr:MAG: RIP metalloprotease RseP [Blastocatellia bacterium]
MRTGQSDEFLSKTKWERFQVLIMGPVMNMLLALVLTVAVLYGGIDVPAYEDQPPVVGVVMMNSAAERADIRPGDRIVSVAQRSVKTWEEFFIAIGGRPNREVSIEILRDGKILNRRVTPDTATGQARIEYGEIGVFPNVHPHLLAISPGEPGERGGLKIGDVILAVEGKPILFHSDFREVIASHPDKPMMVSVLRDGSSLTLSVTPRHKGSIGYLGVTPVDETKSIKPSAVEAVTMSLKRNAQYAGLIFQTIWGLITRETSPKQLMGPLGIAQLSGESAQLGWMALISLMASISLNLGLLNLLPIPILDGGHIFIMALEGLARRDFSTRIKEKMLLAGFVVLMMLMVTVIYNDLTRISWIERLMPWR